MYKTFITASLSFILIFSILAPSVFAFLDVQIEMISLIDISDEEQKEKGEKDGSEKDIITLRQHKYERLVFEAKSTLNYYYLDRIPAYSSKILVPPPRAII